MACLLSNSRFKYVANLVFKPFNNVLTSASQYFRLLMLVIVYCIVYIVKYKLYTVFYE